MTYHSGLGQIFRASESGAGKYVTSLRPYGIGAATARIVPDVVREALYSVFGRTYLQETGWSSGGTVWIRFTHYGTDSDREDKLRRVVSAAERQLGAGRLLLPGESPPAGAAPTPPPADAPMSTPDSTPAESTTSSVTLSATQLQQDLVRRGFSVGSTGVDGDFGTNSRRALDAALSRIGMSAPYTVSSDRRSVTLPGAVLSAIRALPARSLPSGGGGGGGGGSSADTSAPPAPGDEVVAPSGGFMSTPWPWVIGGVVLAGAGAWVLLSSPPKKSAMASNRRRRHR